MANDNVRNSFNIINSDCEELKSLEYEVEADFTGQPKDVVWLDSAGRVTTTGAAGAVLGIQISEIYGADDKVVETVGSAVAGESKCLVNCDPNVIFEGVITTGALADAYTTRSAAACFDVAGSAEAQYVDAAANTRDEIKVIGASHELDTGTVSAVGANQRKKFMFNKLTHVFGSRV